MNVSDFIGYKVRIELPDVPILYWYSCRDTGVRVHNVSPYNGCTGIATHQHIDDTTSEEDCWVFVKFDKPHILPNGQIVDGLPFPIENLKMIEEDMGNEQA